MKTKNYEKKLTLNKKTIANLSSSEMNSIKGVGINTITCRPTTTKDPNKCFSAYSPIDC